MEKGHVISSQQQTGRYLRLEVAAGQYNFPNFVTWLQCMWGRVKTERSEPALEEESNFGFCGRRREIWAYFILALSFATWLPVCSTCFYLGGPRLLPRPGLMRTAEAPTMETVCALWMTDCPYTLDGTQPLPNPTPNTPPSAKNPSDTQ